MHVSIRFTPMNPRAPKKTSNALHQGYFFVRPYASATWKQTNRDYVHSFTCNRVQRSHIGTLNLGLSQIRSYASSGGDVVHDGIVSFKLADIGEGIAECEIRKWLVKEGDTVHQFDGLCEVESDKATVNITSRYDGVITRIYYKQGELAKVGSPLVDIRLSKESQVESTKQPEEIQGKGKIEHKVSIPTNKDQTKILATPAVRHYARKHNINLGELVGTGKDGRILKSDIMSNVSKSSPTPSVTGHTGAGSKESANISDRLVPLSGYSRIMARTMTIANEVPHFGYNDEVIMDKLLELRRELKKIGEERGVKITYMPFILKAASLALKRYPILNAVYKPEENSVLYKQSHNLGVAMDTPNGLVVPNIKNVQDKTILEIAHELNRLQSAAANAGLAREDLTGGTFTLSNIGAIGGTTASPVLVVPEVAIGALGKIQKLPRFDDKNNVVPMHIMCISWSADHRVIDGATMARFSNLWKQYLENPQTMLIEMK